jgi:hypothetical protein
VGLSRGLVQCPIFLSLSESLSPSVGFLSSTEQNTDLWRCRPTFHQCKNMAFPTSAFTDRHPPCPDPKFILVTASERRKPATTAKHPRRNVPVPFRACIASDVGVPNLVCTFFVSTNFGEWAFHLPPKHPQHRSQNTAARSVVE